jgi:hypothetical protein
MEVSAITRHVLKDIETNRFHLKERRKEGVK